MKNKLIRILGVIVLMVAGCNATSVDNTITPNPENFRNMPTNQPNYFPRPEDYFEDNYLSRNDISRYYDALLIHEKAIKLTRRKLQLLYNLPDNDIKQTCVLPELSITELPTLPTVEGLDDVTVLRTILAHVDDLRKAIARKNGEISQYNQSKVIILADCIRDK